MLLKKKKNSYTMNTKIKRPKTEQRQNKTIKNRMILLQISKLRLIRTKLGRIGFFVIRFVPKSNT